jgi:hypothetical protein
MISNMILVLSKGIICLTSGVMCYVWLTYGYAKGEGVSNIAFPLVLSMMFGYFVVRLSLLNAVSVLCPYCVHTVSILFPVAILFPYCGNTVSTLCQCFNNISSLIILTLVPSSFW